MKIRRGDIREVAAMLNDIKITRLPDKDVKLCLVHDYLELRKASQALMEDARVIATKFMEDWRSEHAEVTAARRKGERVDEQKYAAFLSAERDANEAIASLNDEETEVVIEPIGMDAFIAGLEDDLKLSAIGYLADLGIIKTN